METETGYKWPAFTSYNFTVMASSQLFNMYANPRVRKIFCIQLNVTIFVEDERDMSRGTQQVILSEFIGEHHGHEKNNKSGAFLKYFPCLLVNFHLLRTLSRNVRSSASQQGTGDVSLPETIKHTLIHTINLLSGRGQALDLSLQ